MGIFNFKNYFYPINTNPNLDMKHIYALVILCLITIHSYSQRTPDFKAGVGMPYIFGNVDEEQNLHKIQGFPILSLEKPFAFGKFKYEKLSINPGVSYFFFKENEESGTEVVGRDHKLNHHSLNGYVKWLYQHKLHRRSEAFLYAGLQTGLHIYTKTTGTKISNGLNEEEPYLELEVNESGQDFYDLFYYGAVIGFQPNAKVTNFIKPSFELKFYPGMVIRKGGKESVIEFSVLLGFHQ